MLKTSLILFGHWVLVEGDIPTVPQVAVLHVVANIRLQNKMALGILPARCTPRGSQHPPAKQNGVRQ